MAATLAQNDPVQGNNLGTPLNLFKKTVTYSAGNPTAALSATSIGTNLSGFLYAVRVQFGGTAPNSLTVTLTDAGRAHCRHRHGHRLGQPEHHRDAAVRRRAEHSLLGQQHKQRNCNDHSPLRSINNGDI